MAAAKLSATVVTYRSDLGRLEKALASLRVAIDEATRRGLVSEAFLFIVDNGPPELLAPLRSAITASGAPVRLLHGHGNVGYGRANNLVLSEMESDIHLVMNPDVELEHDALAAALDVMRGDPTIGVVAPAVCGADGAPSHLCKRYPSVWVLFLRGFAPRFLRRRFAGALDDYEMRDLPADRRAPVPLASGCFMLVRTALFKRLEGFDPGFFMYFEDYDLSLRAGREAKVLYVPEARIVHHGGDAATKGPRHVAWFLRSAWRFFARHGWKVS
jgi:GT2 family glycosyltransferase